MTNNHEEIYLVDTGHKIYARITNPVSYTHLDVYKRQALKGTERFSEITLQCVAVS